MGTITITSSVRGTEAIAPEYATCCGLPPIATTWHKGMGKDATGLRCQNTACPNHAEGTFACTVDIAKKWETYRKS